MNLNTISLPWWARPTNKKHGWFFSGEVSVNRSKLNTESLGVRDTQTRQESTPCCHSYFWLNNDAHLQSLASLAQKARDR